MRLVLVEWVDSFGCSSTWADLTGQPPEPLLCRSVGWLLHDTDACKVVVPHLASSDDAHGHVPRQGCGDMTIPTQAIRRIVDLTPPSEP